MRRSLLHIFAASLLIAAPAAHASVFSSSKASSSESANKADAPLSLMEEISSFLNTLSFSASASEKTDDATANNGCKEDKKTSSKKSAKKSSGGDDTEEEAKPTGPEPIYFGF